MNRQKNFNFIEKNLEILADRIKTRGKLNILDLNIHSEPFYRDLLNLVYDLNLESTNANIANAEAIDLIDRDNKILVQVSATRTKDKIESTLEKEIIETYAKQGFTIKFMFIAEEAKNLRTNTFKNLYKIDFIPSDDIWDKVSLLTVISQISIERQAAVYELFQQEFGNQPDITKINSNLAKIVSLLAKENLDTPPMDKQLNLYDINRKIEHNGLEFIKQRTINQCMRYYKMLNIIYDNFTQSGRNNIIISVFDKLGSFYEKELFRQDISNLERFFAIFNKTVQYVVENWNSEQIEIEVIEMCVKIIAVDAFIKCKIFESPEGYNHVIT